VGFTNAIWSVGDFAGMVRDARRHLHLTQADVAKRTGISRPWISQFEKGKITNPSFDRLLKVCDAVDIRLSGTYGPSHDEPIASQRARTDESAADEGAWGMRAIMKLPDSTRSRLRTVGEMASHAPHLSGLKPFPLTDNFYNKHLHQQIGEMLESASQPLRENTSTHHRNSPEDHDSPIPNWAACNRTKGSSTTDTSAPTSSSQRGDR
jgi:transcriptional regulator with XRE-family HTH domain